MSTETATLSVVDRELPKTAGRRWLVWEDDTPVQPDRLLTGAQAAEAFLRLVTADADAQVEIRQATEEDIEWAGGLDEYELSTHDLCDGSGNLALPVGDAKLWNPARPHLGWACPPSLHHEPGAEDGDSEADEPVAKEQPTPTVAERLNAELQAACAEHEGWRLAPSLSAHITTTAQRYTVTDMLGGSQRDPWASVYKAIDGWAWFARGVGGEDDNTISQGNEPTADHAIARADAALSGYLAGGHS